MTRTVRRIVTGHDPGGKSIVISDSAAPQYGAFAIEGVDFFELWNTREPKAPLTAVEPSEPNVRSRTLGPAGHGSVLRVVDFHPQSTRTIPPRMHRTETIDYGIVLEGEIHLVLDDDTETRAVAGDIVIQRGTDHAWHNRSDQICRIAFILLAGRFDDALRAQLPDPLPLLP
jgi:quercetin dioxygenase-like cupin family protein